jgi:hypothetical protein
LSPSNIPSWLDVRRSTDGTSEYIAEETGEEIVLMKSREGKVIGLENLNFTVKTTDAVRVAFETIAA